MASRFPFPAAAALAALLLAGCAGTPPAPAPSRPAPGVSHHNQLFDNQYVLDYDVEVHYSSLDNSSCYAFLSGTLTNLSDQTLARSSTVAFKVYHGSDMLFRDYTFLRSNAAPGATVQFNLLQSPLHKKQCPSYDRIEASLNLAILKTAKP
ncbi:hypothetical protein EZJ19_11745 [Parasulfuritortus cantonensis]|uniref:Lipoprotein n=1 Tax=Parasulfuritortus cantonensis TaxID=2528202 RepID=A0A4R1B818_9PROT|nr:hypothetical protein [Parasulfuritortus cantonensis]TCJ12898.1 hypothetical protein EZJ19_11745 [Parasulfuritortus cantonensis]